MKDRPVVVDEDGGSKNRQPVAHEDDLQTQLVAQTRTGNRQPVAHEIVHQLQPVAQVKAKVDQEKDGGENFLFEGDTLRSPRQNPSRSRLLAPRQNIWFLDPKVNLSLHKGKILQRLQRANYCT